MRSFNASVARVTFASAVDIVSIERRVWPLASREAGQGGGVFLHGGGLRPHRASQAVDILAEGCDQPGDLLLPGALVLRGANGVTSMAARIAPSDSEVVRMADARMVRSRCWLRQPSLLGVSDISSRMQ